MPTISNDYYSWTHPDLFVNDRRAIVGRGVFTKAPLPADELLVLFGGVIRPASIETDDFGLQITEKLVLTEKTGGGRTPVYPFLIT